MPAILKEMSLGRRDHLAVVHDHADVAREPVTGPSCTAMPFLDRRDEPLVDHAADDAIVEDQLTAPGQVEYFLVAYVVPCGSGMPSW